MKIGEAILSLDFVDAKFDLPERLFLILVEVAE